MLPQIYPLFTLIIAIVWFVAEPSFEPFLQALLLLGAPLSTGVQVNSQYTGTPAYLAGRRIRFLRKHLGISHSQFAELLGSTSELEIINLEKGKAEANLDLLEKINLVTGASIDWLKHGTMKDHICGYLHIHWFPVLFFTKLYKIIPEPEFVPFPHNDCCYFEAQHTQELISHIKELPALQLTVCADPKEWSQVYLLINHSEFRTDIWDLNALDFWHPGWFGEHHHLPAILDFFQQLSKLYPDIPVKGCFLSRKELLSLKSGLVSPCNRKLARKIALNKKEHSSYKNIVSWPIDLVDIHQKEYRTKHYQHWYGKKFVVIQKYFKEHSTENN